MDQKKTTDLEKILENVKTDQFEDFQKTYRREMIESGDSFVTYFREVLQEKHLTQQTVFIRADVPERYGYKLLSGEKRTRQRDVILRLLYAADFTLDETQKFLRMYELPELYAKIPRDALLMIIFREHTRNILEINELLKGKGFDPLRTSGVQD